MLQMHNLSGETVMGNQEMVMEKSWKFILQTRGNPVIKCTCNYKCILEVLVQIVVEDILFNARDSWLRF